MPDEKDRLGEKLRDVEKGREDQYFAQKDRELINKLKREQAQAAEMAQKQAALMRCPKCGEHLQQKTEHDITIEECPSCGGIWLDKGEFKQLADRESAGWFGRLWRARNT